MHCEVTRGSAPEAHSCWRRHTRTVGESSDHGAQHAKLRFARQRRAERRACVDGDREGSFLCRLHEQ
eukprot:6183495-Pleurochrysis_carterae.AAC.1